MLSDVGSLESAKCVKTWFYSLLIFWSLDISISHLVWYVKCIFLLLIWQKCIFSRYNDADTDAYACGKKVRMSLRMRILMQMQLGTGLFFTLITKYIF